MTEQTELRITVDVEELEAFVSALRSVGKTVTKLAEFTGDVAVLVGDVTGKVAELAELTGHPEISEQLTERIEMATSLLQMMRTEDPTL